MPLPNEPTADAILNALTTIGTPDRCIRQIRRLQDVMGIDHFNGPAEYPVGPVCAGVV